MFLQEGRQLNVILVCLTKSCGEDIPFSCFTWTPGERKLRIDPSREGTTPASGRRRFHTQGPSYFSKPVKLQFSSISHSKLPISHYLLHYFSKNSSICKAKVHCFAFIKATFEAILAKAKMILSFRWYICLLRCRLNMSRVWAVGVVNEQRRE